MGLFNKKRTEEVKEETAFRKLWNNPRTHALMVLGIYFIFFVFVLVIINAGSSNNDQIKTLKGKEIEKYFKNLDNKNIKYNYIIKSENNNYIFQGQKNDNKIVGTLTNGEEINTIEILNNECQIITLNEAGNYDVEIDKKCPNDINYDYFDYSNIYSLIKNLKIKKINDKIYKVNINEKANYKIYLNKDIINKIVISNHSDEYELVYKLEDISS